MGVLRSRGPLGRVSEEPNDTRNDGYQFCSDFRTENKYRVNTPLKFGIRLPWGSPWGSSGPGALLEGSQKNPMI